MSIRFVFIKVHGESTLVSLILWPDPLIPHKIIVIFGENAWMHRNHPCELDAKNLEMLLNKQERWFCVGTESIWVEMIRKRAIWKRTILKRAHIEKLGCEKTIFENHTAGYSFIDASVLNNPCFILSRYRVWILSTKEAVIRRWIYAFLFAQLDIAITKSLQPEWCSNSQLNLSTYYRMFFFKAALYTEIHDIQPVNSPFETS